MSSRSQLRIERIEVRRMPGFMTGYELSDLCDGINVIYGPNASGKTTTARTIHSLIWPSQPAAPDAAFAGTMRIDDAEWLVDYDAGRLQSQRDGNEAGSPPVAPVDTRDRYILTLHELLSATTNNADFAEAILRESAGGYDLQSARTDLKYQGNASQPRGLITAVRQAKAAVREAEMQQADLLADERRLAELQASQRTAQQAATVVDQLKQELHYLDALRDCERLRDWLETFPKPLGLLAGNELQRLDEIRQRIDELRQRERAEQEALEAASAVIERSGLAGRPLPSPLLPILREQHRELQQLAGALDGHRRQVEQARAERDAARRRIAEEITDEQLLELDTTGLRDLAMAVRRWDELRAELAAAEALHDWLGDARSLGDLRQLQEAISLLHRWLRLPAGKETATNARSDAITRVAAILVIIEGVLLGIIGHPVLFIFALVGIVLLLLTWNRQPNPEAARVIDQQAEYAKLGLELPERWAPAEVEQLVGQLNTRLSDGLVEQQRAQRWASLVDRLNHLSREESDQRENCRRLADRLGATVPETAVELVGLVDKVARWQDAERQWRKAEVEREQTNHAYDQLLDKINVALAPYEYVSAQGQAEVAGFIEVLTGQLQQYQSAEADIAHARRALEQTVLPDLQAEQGRYREFFVRLGLEPDDEQTLRTWLDRLPDYEQAKTDLQRAEFNLQQAAAVVTAPEDLVLRGRDALTFDLRQQEALAMKYDELGRQIVEIQTRIMDAKKARDLEKANATLAEKKESLRDQREADYEKVAGWMLSEFVSQRTRDRDRPQVFHRARELFSLITHGRYLLQFDEGSPPTFRATDTITNVGQSLDELSSATRLQLLMAVRVAFVEVQEQGPMLPLILDETLGNSDEFRARAIIDATIEITRTGRQIFYFTAQHDEVGKWQGILRLHDDIPHRTINLAEVRQLADRERLPRLESVPLPVIEIPEPSGTSHAEYGRELRVAGVDLWDTPCGGLHLWYVVPEPKMLHQLLRSGITSWGQLENLVSYGGVSLFDDDHQLYQRIVARARVVRALVSGWQVGRGRPLDRAALAKSGAVSGNFINEVSNLAHKLDGDASRLIEALERGDVKRFRQASINELREFCVDHGYLSTDSVLSSDEIRVRVLAAAADDVQAGLIDVPEIDDLLVQALPLAFASKPSVVPAHAG